MKKLLFDLLIGATLIAVGATGQYLYNQWAILSRFDEVLKTEQLLYDSGDLYYIAIGEHQTKK